jgi:tetratricopeptide (TPR) repeat protein
MSTEEPKAESAPSDDVKAEAPPNVDAAVAWPPPEAAPENADAATKPPSPASPADSGVMTAPDQPPAEKPAPAADGAMPAAAPQEEMGLSNSTLHWLEDGDQAVPGRLTEPGSMASYDPRAPVPGRKRAFLVVGLAGLVALIIAGALYAQAEKRRATQAPTPAAVEPARDLTTRAEAALAVSRLDEALELAHLALVADPRFADAHFVVASVSQARNQNQTARDEFRKYLELAPLGTHAQAARAAMSSLPP